MRAMVHECNRGAVRCVILEADAGLGKTTLLSALCRQPYHDSEEDGEDNSENETRNERDVRVVRVQAWRWCWVQL